MSNKISHVFCLPNFAFCFGLYHKYFTVHNPIFWQHLRFLAKNGIILCMKSPYKYFPVNEAQKAWGLFATCAGHNTSRPGDEFPSRAHPDEYFFSWEHGRILHEWQLILVERGCGVVEFRKRRATVKEGSLVVLPPGCWHRYRPGRKTGWTTLWIGFGGDLASRLVGNAGFSPDGEVRTVAHIECFRRLFTETVANILERGRDNIYSTAAQIPILVAALLEAHDPDTPGSLQQELVHRAQSHIAEHASETVDFASLAESLGVPYRTFRYLFTKETGTSPLQYQLDIRLARAKNLLAATDMSITEIARSLGFSSSWYFAHFFQRRAHTSAAAYRKRRKA